MKARLSPATLSFVTLRVLLLALLLLVGCAELRRADANDGGAVTPADGGGTTDSDGGNVTPPGDAGNDATTSGPLYYDDVQKALEAKRFPGPTTAAGSRGA